MPICLALYRLYSHFQLIYRQPSRKVKDFWAKSQNPAGILGVGSLWGVCGETVGNLATQIQLILKIKQRAEQKSRRL